MCCQMMVLGRCPSRHRESLRGLKCTGALQEANGTSSNRAWRDQSASRAGGAGFMELPRRLIKCKDESFVVVMPPCLGCFRSSGC